MQNIKEFLSYDPDTGVFTWIKKPAKNIVVGRIAGNNASQGRIQIAYNKKRYYAHRLAWWYVYGEMPKYCIDHINEDPSDNRMCNLRMATHAQNMQNKSNPQLNNTSGFKGVHFVKLRNKWLASIKVYGVTKHIGYYNTSEEASDAYLEAKRELHTYWVEK